MRIDTPTIALVCKYVGTEEEDAPLNSISRVKYEWGLADFGGITTVVQAGKSLHAKLSVPTELKIPLLCVCLPAKLMRHRLVPAMNAHNEVECRGIAIARQANTDVRTTFITMCGRRVEHIMCAHVVEDVWLCHPGGLLSPRDLVKVNVDATTGVKKARMAAPTHRLEFTAPSEKLDKLLAIAHLRAEMAKADMEARAVDLDAAEELFNKNPLTWSCRPKEVFIIW